MKKIFALLIAALLFIAMVGCTKNDETQGDERSKELSSMHSDEENNNVSNEEDEKENNNSSEDSTSVDSNGNSWSKEY